MTTLLLLSIPWGYLIAALFLLIAIILFIVAIFMKDTGNDEEYGQEAERYEKRKETYRNTSYEKTFDRYQNATGTEHTEDSLQDMIAETSEKLSETRTFTPIVDIPEPEPYEEPPEAEEITEEAEPEAFYESPAATFEDFAEPAETEEPAELEEEDITEIFTTEDTVSEKDSEAPIAEEDEFQEAISYRKSGLSRSTEESEEEDEVPKPVTKQKSGMSFAEEVRRLIEEEEKRNRNA